MSVVLLIVLALGVCGYLAYNMHDAVIRRELRKAKKFKIGDLPEGQLGRIVGPARRFASVIQAPLSGRRCFAYRILVEEQSGKNDVWRDRITEQDGVPFFLEDETGRAVVDPTQARVSLEIDSRTQSGTMDDPTETEQAFLAKHGERGQGFLGFNRKLRYSEGIIEEGELIAVLGAGVREPDPEAPPTTAYRGEQPTRLRLTSSKKYPLVISDAEETTS